MRLNRDIRRDAFLARIAEDLHDGAGWRLRLGRKVEDSRHDHLTRFRRARLAFRNQNAVIDLRIVGNHDADTAFAKELAGDLLDAPLEDLHDPPVRTVAPIAALHLGGDTVPVQQGPHVTGRQVDSLAAIVRQDKTEALRATAKRCRI